MKFLFKLKFYIRKNTNGFCDTSTGFKPSFLNAEIEFSNAELSETGVIDFGADDAGFITGLSVAWNNWAGRGGGGGGGGGPPLALVD